LDLELIVGEPGPLNWVVLRRVIKGSHVVMIFSEGICYDYYRGIYEREIGKGK
jgi:hypothetical protein